MTGTEFLLENVELQVESLLFVAEGAVALEDLARALECDRARIEAAVQALAAQYGTRGFRLQRTHDHVQMVSAPEAATLIQKFLGLESSNRLSNAALETLAIIAYRQPITRPLIEHIRGVNCDAVIASLAARGLIQEVGRLETVGHPIQYGTSVDFLQYFGMESLDELPPLPSDIGLGQETKDVADLLRGREASAAPAAGPVETPAGQDKTAE